MASEIFDGQLSLEPQLLRRVPHLTQRPTVTGPGLSRLATQAEASARAGDRLIGECTNGAWTLDLVKWIVVE